MFFFKRFEKINTNDECLNKILSIFSVFENDVLTGKYNLCLTVEFLMYFDDLNCNLNNDLVEETFKEKYQTKVDRLRSSFKNLTLLKVTGKLKESFKLKFDLKYFTNLKSLELENVYIDNILNLNAPISQLTTIKLNRCLSSKPLEEFFVRSGDAWTVLNCLCINRAVFKDDEFKFVPISTEILRLQWNQIERFNLNSFTRHNLTELDLSFNKLKAIPQFDAKEVIFSTLKVLKLRGNLINSLQNIETLHQLEHLDLSANLICNKDEIITYLALCKKLKSLNLIDNPVYMLDSLNVLILEVFPNLQKLNNHLCYSDRSSDKNSTTSSNAADFMFKDFEDKNSMISKNDESLANSSRTAMPKKDRVAVILDRTNSFANNTDEQSDRERLSSVSTSKGLSLGLENNVDLNEIIAEQRKSLNKKLLSRPPTTTDLAVPYSTPVDQCCYNIVGELQHHQNQDAEFRWQQSTPNNKSISSSYLEQQLKATISDLIPDQVEEGSVWATDDDGLVFNSDRDNHLKDEHEWPTNNEQERKESVSSISSREDNQWSNEDMDGDNIFIVNKLDSNMVESADPIFIKVKGSLIYEKDCATGKIFEVYDLNVITNYEVENSSTISLIFDSKVKSKQKVTYNLELDSQLKKFKGQFVDPFVVKNQEEKLNQRFKYECLKCGCKNVQQAECSTCKATALIECSDYTRQVSQTTADKLAVHGIQSSYEEDFLNQVKFKLTGRATNEQQPSDTAATTVSYRLDENIKDEKKKDENSTNDLIESNDEDQAATTVASCKQQNEEELNEKVITLIDSKLENYELEHFVSVDHELKLHLDVKIFSNNERLEHLFECDFSINDTGEISHGRIVITNTCLHLIASKFESVTTSDSNHTFDTFTMPLNKIKNIKLSRDLFFHQCVWLTVENLSGKKKKKKHLVETQTFFIILNDKKLVDLFCDYLENFLNKHEIKLKSNVNTYSLTEKPVKLDTEENIIFSQFIVSLTTRSDLEISKSSRDDLLCLLFEKGCEIILARCEVIANELKFKKICRNDLTNLLGAQLESDCRQLHLYFSKDSTSLKTIEWIIGSYSVNSMSKMIDLIQTIWQNIYKIDLQIHISSTAS